MLEQSNERHLEMGRRSDYGYESAREVFPEEAGPQLSCKGMENIPSEKIVFYILIG